MELRRLPYGVQKTDSAIGGGIPEYFMVLHVGVPGTFKSISALRWSIEQARNGKNVVYVTTEQPMEDLVAQGTQLYQGFVELLEQEKLAIISELRSYIIKNGQAIDTTIRSPSVKGLERAIDTVASLLGWEKIDGIVIDSVSTFWANAPAKARQMAIELKKLILNKYQATSVVVSQTSSLTGQSFGWAIEFVADGIIRFERKEPRLGSSEEMKYYFIVEKMRLTNHEKRYIELNFTDFLVT